MQILGIFSLRADADVTRQVQPLLLAEEQAAWRMVTEDFVRTMHLTDTVGTVVAHAEADSVEDAAARFAELPMMRAGLLDLQIIALHPFTNWEILHRPGPAAPPATG